MFKERSWNGGRRVKTPISSYPSYYVKSGGGCPMEVYAAERFGHLRHKKRPRNINEGVKDFDRRL
jgi:hypothetical protein